MNRFFSPAVAIAFGLFVLLGYFFPSNALIDLRIVIIQWAVILSGAAIFVGVLNLLTVHIKKILDKAKGNIYSLLLVTSLLITLFLGLTLGTDSPTVNNIFKAVILPVESSLLAIMAVTLLYAGFRLLRHRNDMMAIIFLFTAFIVMLGAAPLPFFQLPLIGDMIRPAIIGIFATSSARGILLGVALGTLLTGLRVLIGADRPYGGK